jgi:hypothetical protein
MGSNIKQDICEPQFVMDKRADNRELKEQTKKARGISLWPF